MDDGPLLLLLERAADQIRAERVAVAEGVLDDARRIASPQAAETMRSDVVPASTADAEGELVPSADDPLEAGDELVFVCTGAAEDEVRAVVLGADSVLRTRAERTR